MDIFLSAGDPSGDNAAARLVVSLQKLSPHLTLYGLGQEKLKQLGQEQFAPGNQLAVLGFWEVLKQYRFFRRLMKQCELEIKKRKPDVVVLVDYPGFNLRLAKRIRKTGIPIVYYISPQVWAWGNKRIAQIRELVDLMLLILPFEEEFFQDTGINTRFVGHYLLEDIPENYIASSPPGNGIITILAGSRPQEVQRMLPAMLLAAQQFNQTYGTKAVIAGVKGIFDYEASLRPFASDNIDIVYDNSRQCIYESDIVLTASGTATLETAIIGRPMVVVYRTGWLTYMIARQLINLENIALVNLVLQDEIVPELIQHEAIPEQMFSELSLLWDNEQVYEQIRTQLNRVPDLLGGKGASERAAKLIMEYAGRR